MAAVLPLNPGTVLGLPEKTPIPAEITQFPFQQWDSGVFNSELVQLGMTPKKFELSSEENAILRRNPEALLSKAQDEAEPPIKEGTYHGTAAALTEMFSLIEKRYASFMDVSNFEPILPQKLSMDEIRKLYTFTDPDAPPPFNDGYPPHLNLANTGNNGKPPVERAADNDSIFNTMRLLQTSTLLKGVFPDTFLGKAELTALKLLTSARFGSMGRPDEGTSIADVERYQRGERRKKVFNDVFDRPNVGDLEDWFTDERFSQQTLTGTNPMSITVVTKEWLTVFQTAAATQANHDMSRFLEQTHKDSLYMLDYSYYRHVVGLQPSDPIKSVYQENGKDQWRHGCASVSLFHLGEEGKLRPIGIIIDWKGSLENSVLIFNKHVGGTDFRTQHDDWPWRYAKTCVQVSDWMKHEVVVHLVNTHMIEESTIVAAHRTLPPTHPVYKLLYPHWTKTLALNAAARASLVPLVIVEIIGFEPAQAYQFIKDAYYNFDFKGSYVPTDLASRGFPVNELSSRKFHNYGYARCIYSMWYKIRSYVSENLSIHYESDEAVKINPEIKAWYEECRSEKGARIKNFPIIETLEELTDAVTMCIHLASPQHTSINYLQSYYQCFVLNRPSSLYTPPPTSLANLANYTEADFIDALPMNHPRQWLLSAHLPYLLSFKPGDRESLISYAYSKWRLYYAKTEPGDQKTMQAAEKFFYALQSSAQEFKDISQDLDDADVIPYEVLDPTWNAVSIVI
ncbi:hypothetical protein MMC25_002930 [Agyrium rufum]|nr:hypothetical protein [Agyrium rufum]